MSKLKTPTGVQGLLEGAPGAERVRARMMRRTVIRYLLLAYILCIRRNSSRLTKRFPNMCELIKTGIVRPDEARRIGQEESKEMYGSRSDTALQQLGCLILKYERMNTWKPLNLKDKSL